MTFETSVVRVRLRMTEPSTMFYTGREEGYKKRMTLHSLHLYSCSSGLFQTDSASPITEQLADAHQEVSESPLRIVLASDPLVAKPTVVPW